MQSSATRTGTRHNWGKAFIVIAGPTLVCLIPMAAAPGLQAMAAAFGAHSDGAFFAQMVMTLPSLMVVFGAPLAGMAAEWAGRRACLLACLLLFCLSGAASFLAPNAEVLIAARLVLGLAGGGLNATSLALAADFSEGGPRERLLGSIVATTSTFALIALNLGGYLVDHYGWRAPFALYLLAVPVLLIALRVLERDRPAVRVSRKESRGLMEPLRAYWAVLALTVALTIGMFMAPIQGAFLAQANGITSAATVGLYISACSVVAVFSAASFGWLALRISATRIFSLIAMVYAAGCLLASSSSSPWVVGAGFALTGLGAGLVEATAAMVILRSAHAQLQQRAIGLLMSAIFMGQFLNPLVVDPLRQLLGIHGAFAAVGVAFAVLAVTLLLRLVPRFEQNTNHSSAGEHRTNVR